MKILAFTGMPFSGKSEAVKIAKYFNIPVFRMGDLIWEEAKNQDLEINDKNVGLIATNMRKRFGKDIWAKKTLEKLNFNEIIEYLVIDGIRNIEEVKFLKKEFEDNFILIAIKVSDQIRYKRGMSRNRSDDSQNLQTIKKRDLREKEWGIDKVIESSDFTIFNEGEIEDFRQKVKDLFEDIVLRESRH